MPVKKSELYTIHTKYLIPYYYLNSTRDLDENAAIKLRCERFIYQSGC